MANFSGLECIRYGLPQLRRAIGVLMAIPTTHYREEG